MSHGTSADLGWLPSDSEEQLSLGFRIISNAYKTRMQSLDGENRALRQQHEETKTTLSLLQKKHSSLEVEVIESHQRGNQLADENKHLVETVKKLHRDIQRLELLKQAVLNSITDGERDDEHNKIYQMSEFLQTAAPRTMQELLGDVGSPESAAISKVSHLFSPGSTGSGKGSNGKAFFRQARARLSYESFNQFLASIRRLNQNLQTREQTLDEANVIFGDKNADMKEEFRQLLCRHK